MRKNQKLTWKKGMKEHDEHEEESEANMEKEGT